jgi:hypothetical protein
MPKQSMAARAAAQERLHTSCAFTGRLNAIHEWVVSFDHVLACRRRAAS